MLSNLYQQNGGWHVRYRKGGKRLSKKIGSLADYPLERDIAPVYYQWQAEHAQQKPRKGREHTLATFAKEVFFPGLDKKVAAHQMKPSTAKGYRQMWHTYLNYDGTRKERLSAEQKVFLQSLALGNINLTEFDDDAARRILTTLEALRTAGYSQYIVQNGKVFLSALYATAVDKRYLAINPMHGLKLDAEKPVQKTDEELDREDAKKGYTLSEMERAVACLTGMPRALVAVLAYCALRPGEVAALKWPDYDGETLDIKRAVWEGQVRTPKTKGSNASVPVPLPLRQILDTYKRELETNGATTESWMFPGETGNPIRLSSLAARVVRPAFEKTGIPWKTWYGFRHGVTSYLLLEVGLSIDEVRSILRHDPKSRVLEDHYGSRVAKRAAQKKQVLAIGAKIDAGFAARKAEQQALLIAAAQKAPRMVN